MSDNRTTEQAIAELRKTVRDAFSGESVSMLVEGNEIMQAIDKVETATLCGTLTAEQVRECVEVVYLEGYSDGSVNRGAHIDETDWQAIADELNRQIGGTCEMETDWDYLHDGIPDAPEDTWAYMCSACGWSFRYDRGIKPKHCPNCGKAVKR
jgi:rubrerythrin